MSLINNKDDDAILQLPVQGPGGDDDDDFAVCGGAGADDDEEGGGGGGAAQTELDLSCAWSQEEAMEHIKELVTFIKEINEANKSLKDIKKERKRLEAQVLAWMGKNDVSQVNTSVGAITRLEKERKDTLKKPFIVAQLRVAGKMDEKEATALVEQLWESRPVIKESKLKYDAPGAKKRAAGGAGSAAKRSKATK